VIRVSFPPVSHTAASDRRGRAAQAGAAVLRVEASAKADRRVASTDPFPQERLVLRHDLGILEQTDAWVDPAPGAPSAFDPAGHMAGVVPVEASAAADVLFVNAPARSAASSCVALAAARRFSAERPVRLGSEVE